ncbi:hypothetical protein A6E11_19090 [Aliivibrio fischeri]|nr:hypothetical protein A6E11_19090 [Aliivibrio fischeri]OCH05164.1 hypothetical protein A6E09_18205 [Aliivibrio fischeri]GGK51567.1 hypothetical protein GCM10007987_38100 [Aliivibrio fischeri]
MNWRIFRIIIITLSTCISIMSTYYTVPLESTNLPLIEQLKSLLLIFVASLLGLFFIIGIQAFNPYSSKLWVVPSWEINPFTKKQPIVFFHFVAWFITVQSIVQLIFSILCGYSYWSALLGTVFGLSIFIGLRLVRIAFHFKFRD